MPAKDKRNRCLAFLPRHMEQIAVKLNLSTIAFSYSRNLIFYNTSNQ